MLTTIAALALLAAPPAAGAPSAPLTMPVSEIQRGQKCTGRTVFEGSKIEDFGCEILGVLPGAWGPGEDVIIARLVGPTAERYGVIAGMSGSPIYVDGKLIGALSLSMGTFQKESIAGITPIAAMQRVRSSTGWPVVPRKASGTNEPEKRFATSDLQPILTPLVVSGISPEAMPIAKELLEPHGFMVTAGAGGTMTPAPVPGAAETIQPGSALAGLLVTGDVNIAGTGTVTWRDQDTLLAFGHSFLMYGAVEMPMATSDIITTVASSAISYKMGAPKQVVGSIFRDSRTAIAGRFGKQADMIPVTVTMPEGTAPREIRFNVFRNRALSAPMMTVGVMNGLVSNSAYDAEGTMRIDGRVKIAGHPDIALSRTYFDPGASGGAIPYMAAEINGMLQRVFENELSEAAVSEIELAFGVDKSRRETRIDAAWAEAASVKAGETVAVRVRMRPYRGAMQLREVLVKVPEGTPPGSVTVSVADAKVMDAKDRVAPGYNTRPDDLDAIIAAFNARRDEDSLYVRVSRSTPGAVVRGVNLPALPPTSLAVVRGADKSAGGAEPLQETVVDEVRMPLGARVSGAAEFTLRVDP